MITDIALLDIATALRQPQKCSERIEKTFMNIENVFKMIKGRLGVGLRSGTRGRDFRKHGILKETPKSMRAVCNEGS